MMRYPLFTVMAVTVGILLSPLGTARNEDKSLEEAKALYEELEALRAKGDKYMDELNDLSVRLNQAPAEKREELESQRLLRQRAMERLGKELQEKNRALYNKLSDLILQDPSSVELRNMRYEAAFYVKDFAGSLEDIQAIPKKKNDFDFMMIWGQCLDNLYRFDEAAERFNEVLKIVDESRKPFIRFSMGTCYFNGLKFQKASETFAALAEVAPPEQRQQFMMLSRQAAEYVKLWEAEKLIRDREAQLDVNPLIELATSKGTIKLELFEDQAPNTVANMIDLVEQGFYDGLLFHRVLPKFMAQTGDPEGSGRGGPGYRIADECRQPNARQHFVGSLSMANTGQPDTNGSQFFITTAVTYWLNGKHTVFGRVLEGQDVVNKIAQGDKIIAAKVIRKRDHEYAVKKL